MKSIFSALNLHHQAKSKVLALLALAPLTLAAQRYQPMELENPPASAYLVENLMELNSPSLDFCAVPCQNGVVFTSSRGNGSMFFCQEDLISGRYSDLYFARSDKGGNFYHPELLYGDVNGRYHDGVATFSRNAETMYFSRNHSRGVKTDSLMDLRIYSAIKKKGNWVETQELPVNIKGSATCHPTLSAAEDILVFSSNRPGGYGNMDLYMVKKTGAKWGLPVNLGPQVNTQGNEIFPFLAPDGILYFASDGYQGQGGLDVYGIRTDGQTVFQFVHLPAPVNSPYDDLGFTVDASGRKGYLSSNRPGGQGQDDLYRWTYNGLMPLVASVCAINKATGERIQDARLAIFPSEPLEASPSPLTTAQPSFISQPLPLAVSQLPLKNSCQVQLQVLPGQTYTVLVEKSGYATQRFQLTGVELARQPEYLIPLEVKKTKRLRGEVLDQKSGQPLGDCAMLIKNECTGETDNLKTDALGGFDYTFDCRCDYTATLYKNGYLTSEKKWKAAEIDCNTEQAGLSLYLAALENKKSPAVGDIINLPIAYYDYDRHEIRPGDVSGLDSLVRLMQKHPSLEIELGSHTDARGAEAYNLELSQRRANEAIAYIIRQGIAAHRLKAKGYGESRLINHCSNGVRCSEREHQQNRRTEVKITQVE
jgi:outer membrane protein OmpA-like peptidoglycan-associated protein